ncbi:hypothetical protein AB0I28_24925 [Phytomonospora sp. NPDC050363]|uniref:hypothetical protein n=1 Tax=Phytomonospora sp. NPDC050363 TaxID=3155642 RepID=UPI0033CAEE99
MKVKKWWAVVAGAVLGTAAVGTGAYVAKHRRSRKKSSRTSGADRAVEEKLSRTPPAPLDAASPVSARGDERP